MKMSFRCLFAILFALLTSTAFAQVGVIVPGPRASGLFVVRFVSNVPGAAVYIDGQLTNTTDFTMRLSGGLHDIRVTVPGKTDWHQQVDIQGNTTVSAIFDLAPPPPPQYRVHVNSNARNFQLFVDGQPADRDLSLTPGRHEFRIEGSGYRRWERTMDIQGDTDLQAELIPTPAILKLNFEVRGRVEWRIDGKTVWTDQRYPRLEVSPGHHEILILTGAFRSRLRVDLAPGKVYTLNPVLSLEENRSDDN